MKIFAPRGTSDILPKDQYLWSEVVSVCKKITSDFSYERINTPIFEYTELFSRGVGHETDIVQKEMYTFEDHGGDSITLRPEGTAAICRSYIQNGLFNLPQPTRLFYIAPMFRYERPQAGRLRQHHQFGCEAIGDSSPQLDAEIIELGWNYIKNLGLNNIDLRINSIGDPIDREKYITDLKKFLEGNKNKLPKIDKDRLNRSPLRVLDSKEKETIEINKNAPRSVEYLKGNALIHWNELIELLEIIKSQDKQFNFYIDHSLVRGLDYYNRTVFEFQPNETSSQGTILAGGRYDPLIGKIGGPNTPGIGFGSGIERMILEIKKQSLETINNKKIEVVVIHIGDTIKECFSITSKIRNLGITTILAPKKSIKAQLRYANNIKARFALIIGENEINSNNAKLKPLFINSEEQNVEIDPKIIVKNIKKFQNK
ncbi:MAG: histidine--tRNA ligase [Chloroflexi bacterium]|nr:histidine--tRNA ligase [Chloroflexota bacterium]|tara:strand:+ start:17001 stop:18284 length:1284 start_codon:yes stop_codon:yes gene_type:complete